jgi:hypothetical protein
VRPSWENDPTRQSLVTLTLREKEGKTELTLRQKGLGSVSNRDDHGRGWSGAFNKLVAYLASVRSDCGHFARAEGPGKDHHGNAGY